MSQGSRLRFAVGSLTLAAVASACLTLGSGISVGVRFPSLRVAGLPGATISVPLVVDRGGQIIGSALLTPARPRLTVANLPAGPVTVYAVALGSDSQVLAIGKAETELRPGRKAQALVEMLPLLVWSGDERQAVMAAIRRGFPVDFGLQIPPLPPGDPITPGGGPSAKPSAQPVQLGTLAAEPIQAAVGYPVLLSVSLGANAANFASWDFQWQGGSNDAAASLGTIGSTRLVADRAEVLWTPVSPGTFVFRLTVTNGISQAVSNDVVVNVVQLTGGATVGGNF